MGINVLSLFDGMSCGQMALERAGIKVDNYFASEIDKDSMTVTNYHYPKTVQLWNVRGWKGWKLPKIDLLIGGSPCQGFSNAGEGLNFDDPRSKLFFVYVDIMNDLMGKNPDLLFLLENVKMKKAWQGIISTYMGTEPVMIDSALVSAQSRERLYWANWKITLPEDRGIILADIIEDGDVDRQKDFCLDANYYKGGNPKRYFTKSSRQLVKGAAIRNQVTRRGVEEQLNVRKDDKSNCVVPTYPNRLNGLVFVGGLESGRRLHDGKSFSRNYREGYRIYSPSGKSPSLSASSKGGQAGHSGLIQVGTDESIHGHDVIKRVYSPSGKSLALTDMQGGHRQPKVATDKNHYRKLSPLECERLQTVPDNWTSMVSDTQRYKMLGNGWTVDVIAHIFSCMPKPS